MVSLNAIRFDAHGNEPGKVDIHTKSVPYNGLSIDKVQTRVWSGIVFSCPTLYDLFENCIRGWAWV